MVIFKTPRLNLNYRKNHKNLLSCLIWLSALATKSALVAILRGKLSKISNLAQRIVT